LALVVQLYLTHQVQMVLVLMEATLYFVLVLLLAVAEEAVVVALLLLVTQVVAVAVDKTITVVHQIKQIHQMV
jgi:hypothetical protein